MLCNQWLYSEGKAVARCIQAFGLEHDHNLTPWDAVTQGLAHAITPSEQDAYLMGYQDRVDSLPNEFTSGRTWDNDTSSNEAYDQGVNAAERDYADGQFSLPEA